MWLIDVDVDLVSPVVCLNIVPKKWYRYLHDNDRRGTACCSLALVVALLSIWRENWRASLIFAWIEWQTNNTSTVVRYCTCVLPPWIFLPPSYHWLFVCAHLFVICALSFLNWTRSSKKSCRRHHLKSRVFDRSRKAILHWLLILIVLPSFYTQLYVKADWSWSVVENKKNYLCT